MIKHMFVCFLNLGCQYSNMLILKITMQVFMDGFIIYISLGIWNFETVFICSSTPFLPSYIFSAFKIKNKKTKASYLPPPEGVGELMVFTMSVVRASNKRIMNSSFFPSGHPGRFELNKGYIHHHKLTMQKGEHLYSFSQHRIYVVFFTLNTGKILWKVLKKELCMVCLYV